jgi:FkbM family methyltransferase
MKLKYYSQYKQDLFLNKKIFKEKEHGVFIDIGANDGISHSNSYFFEKELGWTGLCIEPNWNVFEKLKTNRKCTLIHGCCSDKNSKEIFLNVEGYCEMLSGLKHKYDPRHLKRLNEEILIHGGLVHELEVQCFEINTLLKENNFIDIDFISIDTEGGEIDILKSINFSDFKIKVIIIENNYKIDSINSFMNSRNFSKVKDLQADEVYVNKKVFSLFSRLSFKHSRI